MVAKTSATPTSPPLQLHDNNQRLRKNKSLIAQDGTLKKKKIKKKGKRMGGKGGEREICRKREKVRERDGGKGRREEGTDERKEGKKRGREEGKKKRETNTDKQRVSKKIENKNRYLKEVRNESLARPLPSL